MWTSHLDRMSLTRLGDDAPAGLWITSLPWPRQPQQSLTLDGNTTHVQPLGRWPEPSSPMPRRLLMFGDAGPANAAPDAITVGQAADSEQPPSQAADAGVAFSASAEIFEQSDNPIYLWERQLLRLRWGDKSVGIAMGMRVGDELHWWEGNGLVVLEDSPHCLTVEMGGAIPRDLYTLEQLQAGLGLADPYLHKHNWLNGHLLVRLHANGVCEVFAHHFNARYVDYGGDLHDCVPVVAFKVDGDINAADLPATWDGSHTQVNWGGVAFDMTETAKLASPKQPGKVSFENGFVVLQPYLGMELFGGTAPRQQLGSSYIYRAEQRIIPQGMARTLRFSLSLSDRSPRVARYIAPSWWYGMCEEFSPHAALPVSTDWHQRADKSVRWAMKHQVRSGFEDGSIARGGRTPEGEDYPEPGWEGEVGYGVMLEAYRTGDAAAYDSAMRSAYHLTDVALDHCINLVRMHGYPPPALSLPMQRMLATIAAYLETGDKYLYESAEAVVNTAYRQHLNSWPRMAVGRDACFARGAIMLYRYFGDDHYRRIGWEGAMASVRVQRPDGAWGDQGGGTGIHMRSGYVVKPWMLGMATNPIMDYLALFPDEQPMIDAILKAGDWLLAEFHEKVDGSRGWAYQHFYGNSRRHYNVQRAQWIELPIGDRWHQETLGRVLLFCSLHTGDARYFDAFAESHDAKDTAGGDHGVAAALQFLPEMHAQVWHAQLQDRDATGNAEQHDTLSLSPVWFGPRTMREATVETPDGPVTFRWREDQTVEQPDGVDVKLEPRVLSLSAASIQQKV